MFSNVIKAKSKLPIDFVENLYNEFNERTANKILEGMCEKRYTTLRVNTLKYTNIELEKELVNNGIEFENVSWYKDAYIVKNCNESKIQSLEIFKKGFIYLQSLSSMLPALILNPKEGENILDLTAAPGSKTTQISALINNKGYILANEIDKIRFEKLKYNVDLQGAGIVELSNENGINIGKKYTEKFDKVLIDTPCSGEGRFKIDDISTYSKWSTKLKGELISVQRQLLQSATFATKKLRSNSVLYLYTK